MTADESRREVASAPRPKPFRPREVWAGTIVMLVAIFVGAAAVIAQSAILGVITAVLFVAGALIAWHGGIMRDTHAVAPIAREWQEVKDPGATNPTGLDPNDKGRLDEGRN
jgi:hypothetical protein